MRIRHPAADEGKKIVVVVGSGFAGLNAAKALSQSKEVTVFLIDQRNYHLFQPGALRGARQAAPRGLQQNAPLGETDESISPEVSHR